MKYAHLGLRIFAVLLLALTPALVMVAAGWSGAVTPALFAVGGATAAVVAGGLRFGIIMTFTLAIASVIGMPLTEYPWAAAALMVVLGGIYGYWSADGYVSAAALVPALVPYFLRQPPGIFSAEAPTVNAGYLAAFFLVFTVSGIWASIVMSKLVLKGKSFPGATQRRRPVIALGLILGTVAGIVVAVALRVEPNAQWAWITLTMFLLANPTGKIDPKQVRDRVTGTLVGLIIALLLSTLSLSSAWTSFLAVALITAALVTRIDKKPYWLFVMIQTPAVVLMDASGSSTEVVAEQRLLFTLLGVFIIVALTLLLNLAYSLYLHRHPRDEPVSTPAT